MIILISFLSCIIDNTISYYLPLLPNVFQYLKPMFFVSGILIYMIVFSNNKKTLYIVLITGLIYDLLFGSIYFLYLILFSILYIFITVIKKIISTNTFIDLILFIVGLILFITLKFLILIWVNYYDYSLLLLLDEILSSLIINILYSIIVYYFLGIKFKKN